MFRQTDPIATSKSCNGPLLDRSCTRHLHLNRLDNVDLKFCPTKRTCCRRLAIQYCSAQLMSFFCSCHRLIRTRQTKTVRSGRLVNVKFVDVALGQLDRALGVITPTGPIGIISRRLLPLTESTPVPIICSTTTTKMSFAS